MSSIGFKESPQVWPLARRRSLRPRSGVILLLSASASEGVLAAMIIIAVAMLYHFFALGETPSQFQWPLYVAVGTAIGLFHAGLTVAAYEKFLAGRRGFSVDLPDCFYSWTASFAVAMLGLFLLGSIAEISRATMASAYVLGIPALVALRGGIQTRLKKRIRAGDLQYTRIAMVGRYADIVRFLLERELWSHGQALAGMLLVNDLDGLSAEQRQEAASRFAMDSIKRGSEHIVLCGTMSDLEALEDLIDEFNRFSLNVSYAPATKGRLRDIIDVTRVGHGNTLRIIRKPLADRSVALKRAMDILISLTGLAVLSPLFAVVSLAIVLDSRGPAIFRQERRGANGELFRMWKFRSMTVTQDGYSMSQATVDDPRVTRVGRLLRPTSIDELPQLVNVLLGHMSIVGPRPHAISQDDELTRQVENYANRRRIKPGITGWAQIHGYRGEIETPEDIHGRTLLDLEYIDRWSIFLDLWIIVLTLLSPTARRNAY